MTLGKKVFPAHQDAPTVDIAGQPLDRRRFLQYAAGVGAMVGLSGTALARAQQAIADANQATGSSDSRLPDGTEHVSWEQPLTFSKTYYVDNGNARADDNGP